MSVRLTLAELRGLYEDERARVWLPERREQVCEQDHARALRRLEPVMPTAHRIDSGDWEGDRGVVSEQLTVDVLDDETQRTPAWEDMRAQQRKVGTLPRGTYDAQIRDVAIVRRRDDGSHVLRVIVRTTRLERDALAWQGLSGNRDDPFDLDEQQVRALRRFADRLCIPTPCSASAVVNALTQIALNGEVIQVRVTQTPVGQQATLSREVTGSSTAVVLPMEEDLEGAARVAHAAHMKVLSGLTTARQGFVTAAEGCFELHASEGWRALGFESLNEYLACPEVTLGRTDFYRLVEIWRVYVLDGGIAVTELRDAAASKLEVPLPALSQSVVSAEQAVADATSMTRRDLRLHYAEMLGSANGTELEDSEAPSRRRDTDSDGRTVEHVAKAIGAILQRASGDATMEELARAAIAAAGAPLTPAELTVAEDVTRSLVKMLQRVLAEVGRPEQKRMSRDLREALTALLAQAEEQGL